MASTLERRVARIEAAQNATAAPSGASWSLVLQSCGETMDEAFRRAGVDPGTPNGLVVQFVDAVDGRPATIAG